MLEKVFDLPLQVDLQCSPPLEVCDLGLDLRLLSLGRPQLAEVFDLPLQVELQSNLLLKVCEQGLDLRLISLGRLRLLLAPMSIR